MAGAQTQLYMQLRYSVWYRSHVLQKFGLETAILNFDSLHEVNPSAANMTYNVSIFGAFLNFPECKTIIT